MRGFALRFSTNVADRSRWLLPILVSDTQQMPDGTINDYTAAQQLAHLDELVRETAPLQFSDLDGTVKYVRVTGWNKQVDKWEWKAGTSAPKIDYVFPLQLEEK